MVPEKDIFRKRLFHYYISGFSGKPIETEDQNITLQSLPSGNFTISVSCNLANGLWSDPQKKSYIFPYCSPGGKVAGSSLFLLLLLWLVSF